MNVRKLLPFSLQAASLVLTCVQHHPDLSSRRACKNSGKYRGASDARVVLFLALVRGCADSVQCEVRVRRLSRGLSVKLGAQGARLNPKVH